MHDKLSGTVPYRISALYGTICRTGFVEKPVVFLLETELVMDRRSRELVLPDRYRCRSLKYSCKIV